MRTENIINQLEQNRLVFQSQLAGLGENVYSFRPDKYSWTILEILCHLVDEEREDFRTRVTHSTRSVHDSSR